MKTIPSGELYAEKCLQAENGNAMARLEVNAHRARVFAADLYNTIVENQEEDNDDCWTPVREASLYLVGYLQGAAVPQAQMEERAYDPVFPLNQTGMIANHLHELGESIGEHSAIHEDVLELWEKLSHVQYLLGTLYPHYIAVLKEARLLANGGLSEYADRMQAEATAILEEAE